jgi:hypothetical protein
VVDVSVESELAIRELAYRLVRRRMIRNTETERIVESGEITRP